MIEGGHRVGKTKLEVYIPQADHIVGSRVGRRLMNSFLKSDSVFQRVREEHAEISEKRFQRHYSTKSLSSLKLPKKSKANEQKFFFKGE